MADNALRNSFSTKAQLYSWDPKQEKYKTCKQQGLLRELGLRTLAKIKLLYNQPVTVLRVK